MATQTKGKKSNNSKKKTTTTKKTAGKQTGKKQSPRTAASKKNVEVQAANSVVSSEVILWVTLGASVLLFLGDLGFGGIVGDTVSRFFFGLFGVLSYIFPFALIYCVFFLVSNKENQVAVAKVVSAVFLFLFLITFVDLMLRKENVIAPSLAYLYGYENKSGGGFFGGALAFTLVRGFGLVGAYVIDVIGMIISIVLITEKSAFKFLENKSKHQKIRNEMRRKEKQKQRELRRQEIMREKEERQREAALAKKNEEKKPRVQMKSEGVSFSTKIEEKTGSSDDMNELNINIYNASSEVEEVNRVPLTSNTPSKSTITQEAGSNNSTLGNADKDVTEHFEEERPVEAKPVSEPKIHMAEPVEIKTVDETPEVSQEEAVSMNSSNVASRPRSTKETRAEAETEANKVSDEIASKKTEVKKEYVFPTVDLLNPPKGGGSKNTREVLQETATKLEDTLRNFGVNVTVTDVSCGPAVTRYELQPETGVKVSRITNLADDIKLNLAATDIRIEAPIPGKSAVGIEVPNKEAVMVTIRELMESSEFHKAKSKIAFAAGRDIGGNVIISDIGKMPHLLIAGSTGSGKSVCINTIIMSILFKASPDEVKLIMIDPKVVELSVYNGIPHLLIPVVTDPKKAAGALHWAVSEMTDRYQKFAEAGVRDMAGFNAKIKNGQITLANGDKTEAEKMPQIVVIVDELADLMMVSSKEVEEAICRLAQLARAAGIHLIIATQRPSVNVITGLIKANMPSRVAFAVTSGVDSRTILDMVGAEKLLGKGDMLYYPQGFTKPLRVQGAFVSDGEVSKVVSFIKDHMGESTYDDSIQSKIDSSASSDSPSSAFSNDGDGDDKDTYFADAARLIIEKEKGSIGMLQRNFKIGFNRAARIMDQLEDAGIVGPEEGTKPRKVLVTLDQLNDMVSGM
ncbi:MAG: DNA translocase FtsK [Lachnospiraceae bacterium]|nr:DNA translocase FtsK [Lachnospiraceae bacterium]